MKLPKPKRGECGTCHWFEPAPTEIQPADQPRQGTCVVKPPAPIPVMTLKPGSQLLPSGPQAQQGVQGIRPPTHELLRCGEWIAFGTFPPPEMLQ
jgi:hypothetical protein